MSVNIVDPKCLELMSRVEFPDRPNTTKAPEESFLTMRAEQRRHWRAEQLAPEEFYAHGADDYTFIGALRWAAKNRMEFIESEVECTLKRMDFPTTGYVIYGTGGMNRWIVRFEGNVEFSAHHSTGEKVKLAGELGFDVT